MTPFTLATTTVTFQELINGRQLEVPRFQRGYSWTEEYWEDLWNDLMAVRFESRERHFMGPIVLRYENAQLSTIIDGQQRIATLSVLTLAVIDKLGRLADEGVDPDRNRERANVLRNRYIGQKHAAALVETSRLRLSRLDDEYYRDRLVQLERPFSVSPFSVKGLPESNARLWNCFAYFGERLDRSDIARDGAAIASIIADKAALGLLFLVVTVPDELDAYTVFETLNARGLPLTTGDLLKNAIFANVSVPSELDYLERRWNTLMGVVGSQRFPDFLRYHLLCEGRQIPRLRLYPLVRERLDHPDQVLDLVVTLERRARLWAAMADPEHDLWVERPATKFLVLELGLFRSRQPTPLFFAAWEQFSDEDFDRVLKLVVAITLRAFIGGRNGNALEMAYAKAAEGVLAGRLTRPRAVFSALRGVYVDDDAFERSFAIRTMPSGERVLLRYVLGKLEADAGGIVSEPGREPASVEHILPQHPTDEWYEMVAPRHFHSAVNRIGNATLLEPTVNRRLGAAPIADKRRAYERSAFALTRQVAKTFGIEWALHSIDARQRAMAKRAVQVWRSDFD